MEQKEISDLLTRYKNGLCTPQEKTRLESWYDMRAANTEWTWTEEEKIDISQTMKNGISERTGSRRVLGTSKPWLWAAASVLIFLIAGALYQNLKMPVGTGLYSERSVPAGQTSRFTLSDGSVVFLNGASKLSFPEKFDTNNREITLVEGEAYFDIKHDETRPFTVKTAGASIRVLGTAFNVRSYNAMEEIRVTVARGKVAVNGDKGDESTISKEVLLVRDEQVSINKQSGNVQKSHISSESITGWTEGKLIFNNESLGYISSTLKYTRNLTVRFAEPDIASIRCSAGFDSTDSVEDIISALSRANGLNYTITKNEVVFKKK